MTEGTNLRGIFAVLQRTALGTWNDGFIHAGNLAYLSMLAIFPFFILGSALFELFGGNLEQSRLIGTVLGAMPTNVVAIIEPIAEDTMQARRGWLLWAGAAVALWTVSSLIETIRDLLRRAYETTPSHAYWLSRLLSIVLGLIAVLAMMLSLFAQVAIGGMQQVIANFAPQLVDSFAQLRLSRAVPAIGLFISLYLLFLALTPVAYRKREFPKWPGALATSLWWLGAAAAMPPLLSVFFTYNMTYGSVAGFVLVLFFFWLVGLGLVMGAELNAALAKQLENIGLEQTNSGGYAAKSENNEESPA